MKLDKNEIKIFLTFFIIYSFFVSWTGWNEFSHYALVKAIVEEDRFEIDSFANQTSDRAFFKNHYYTDKAPGLAFLTSPPYAGWKFICYNFFPKEFIQTHLRTGEYFTWNVEPVNLEVIDYINPGFFDLSSMIIITIFISSFFGALLMIIVYKLTEFITKNEKYRLLSVISIGFGTSVFSLSTVFLNEIVGTFFAFLSFYIIYKNIKKKSKNNKFFILAGILAGFSIVILYYSILVAVIIFLYILLQKKKIFIINFLIGFIIGLLPLFLYNFVIFKNIFALTYFYSVILTSHPFIKFFFEFPYVYLPFEQEYGLTFYILKFVKSLFYTDEGLFFYSPIIFLAVLSLFYFRKNLFENKFIILLFLIFIFLVPSNLFPISGGAVFGYRYFTPLIPFMAFPLALFIKKMGKHKVWQIIFYVFLIFSIFNFFIGLQPKIDYIDYYFANLHKHLSLEELKLITKTKFLSIESFSNIIYEYYLPLFFQYGPRSRIFENLINGQFPIDIRYNSFEIRKAFKYFYFYIPFLSLLPIAIIIGAIWNKEIFTYFKKNNIIKKYKLKIIIFFIFFLCFGFLLSYYINPPEKINYEKGWYPPSAIDELWVKQDGIIALQNPSDFKKIVKFSTLLTSYFKDREVEFYFNNKFIDKIHVYNGQELEYNQILNLIPGKNTVKFHSLQKCDIPNVVEKTEDKRCLNIQLRNSSLTDFNETILYTKEWYPQPFAEEVRWMLSNGTFIVNKFDVPKAVKFTLGSFHKNRTVKIFVNEVLFEKIQVPTSGIEIGVPLKVNTTTTIRIEPFESCEIPKNIIISDDKRCLTISITKLKIV